MSGSGGYAGTTARTEVANAEFNWGTAIYDKTDMIFTLSETGDASSNILETRNDLLGAFPGTHASALVTPVSTPYAWPPGPRSRTLAFRKL